MTQLGAVANDATQVVASQASNFAAAASTGGGNNGVPINVAQVLTTITKLKSAMELVVDVIGELEPALKRPPTRTNSSPIVPSTRMVQRPHPTPQLPLMPPHQQAHQQPRRHLGKWIPFGVSLRLS